MNYFLYISLSLSLLLIGMVAEAARLTDSKVKHSVSASEVLIKVEKGFHINEKAPMTFKFFVCDDKNTVCEQHEIKPTLKK
jgi:hypothetical protein